MPAFVRASMAIMQSAQDGLVLDGKEAAVIPFKGKAQYIPMVAGLVKKMRQHSDFANISHGIIYSKEVESGRFTYIKGDDESLTHNPDIFGDRGEPLGAYAVVTMKDGTKFRAVMRKEDIEKRLAVGNNSPAKQQWKEEFWIKTVIKAVYKIAPNSGDQAGVLDQVFAHDDGDEVEHDAPLPPASDAPKQTRAAAAVKAAAPPPEPEPEIEEAEILPPDYDDEPPI